MKRFDIRKIYVCEIMKQGPVREIQRGLGGHYTWNYEEDDNSYGLFVRGLGGYKHILTDTIYKEPSRNTGNQHVINPRTIELLVKKERALASHLIGKYKTFYMERGIIELLENRVNDNNLVDNYDQLEMN